MDSSWTNNLNHFSARLVQRYIANRGVNITSKANAWSVCKNIFAFQCLSLRILDLFNKILHFFKIGNYNIKTSACAKDFWLITWTPASNPKARILELSWLLSDIFIGIIAKNRQSPHLCLSTDLNTRTMIYLYVGYWFNAWLNDLMILDSNQWDSDFGSTLVITWSHDNWSCRLDL